MIISPEWLVGTLVLPLIFILVKVLLNQKQQIDILTGIADRQQTELSLLRAIVLELAPADVIKRHLQKPDSHD
jgi:mannitol/fructose-specific phosphotransferase system IIA component